MLISTRGRYALRVMVELAERGSGNFVPLREISESQGISVKYLESIASELSKAGLLEGQHGKGGGYKLAVPPEKISVKSVLCVTEGHVSPVACLKNSPNACERAKNCRTLPLWEKLYDLIDDFFENVTVHELAKGNLAETNRAVGRKAKTL